MRNRRCTTAARGRAFALALTLSLSAVVPIAADARGHHRRHQHHRAAHAQHVIRWGSSLASTATQTIPGTYAQDAEFWLTQLGSQPLAGVEPVVTAPVSGVIKRVLLKVGDDSNAVPIRFSVVKALGDGRTEVLTTSTPHLILPAHTPGIHTFDFSQLQFKMPINKGSPGRRTTSTSRAERQRGGR